MPGRSRRFLPLILWVAFLISLTGLPALSQSDLGTISGFVRDPSGAAIPNARVSVQNQSGIERSVTTNDSGFYTITNIPAGFYALHAEASGFQKYQSNDNKLDPSGHLTINVPLAVGAATETVQV